jgi:hypothetical protein
MAMLELTEGQSRLLEIVAKSIGGIFAIILLGRGIYEFRVSKEREFKIEVYREQVDIMKEFVDCTSKLATEPKTSKEFSDALKDFYKMRVGKLFLFSDDTLDNYVGEYFSMTNKFIQNSAEVTQTDLATQSAKISSYCKKQITALTKID